MIVKKDCGDVNNFQGICEATFDAFQQNPVLSNLSAAQFAVCFPKIVFARNGTDYSNEETIFNIPVKNFCWFWANLKCHVYRKRRLGTRYKRTIGKFGISTPHENRNLNECVDTCKDILHVLHNNEEYLHSIRTYSDSPKHGSICTFWTQVAHSTASSSKTSRAEVRVMITMDAYKKDQKKRVVTRS